MKKLFLILACAVFAPLSVLAQSPKAPKCSVFRPKVLGETVLKETSVWSLGPSNQWGQANPPQSLTYWEAYSDRANNTTYMSPSQGAPVCGKLEFNDVVRIAKIENDFALVYSEPTKNVSYPRISGDATFKGWVPMQHLLLWSGCLADKHGIFYKALLCSNYDAANNAQAQGAGRLVHDKGYKTPDKNSEQYSIASGGSQFFYIMKRENNMVLLATQSTMEGTLSQKLLYCWVEAHNFVPWNQRTCLEPNWNQEDVEYFIKQGVKVHQIYSDKGLSGELLANITVPVRDSLPKDALYMDPADWDNLFRWPGDKLRLPILASLNNSWNISTFVAPGATIGVDPKQQEADRKNREKLEKKLHINLVFVVDGTNSMKPYFEQVREAIKTSLSYFATEQKVKVGVVIYRNKADGEKVTAVCPLTPRENIARVTNFLDKTEAASVGKTEEEALYTGLNVALEKMRFGEGESNMIMVVGDCGEKIESNDTERVAIVQKLKAKDIHLMAFQVKNLNKPAYTAFTQQMNYLISRTMLQNNRKWVENAEEAKKIGWAYKELKKGDSKGYDFYAKGTNEPNLYIGYNCVADPSINSGIMPPYVLQTLINGTVKDFAATIQTQLDILVKRMSGVPQASSLVKQGDGTVNITGAFADKILEKGIKSNAVVNFAGYTKKLHSSGREFFKPVLFIEEKELQELLKELELVKMAADRSDADNRKPYINALRALIGGLTGSLSETTSSKMTQQDIMNMIGGLAVNNSAAAGPTLDELNNPQAVSNEEYLSIIIDFSKKVEMLRNIANSEEYRKRYAKDFNGECFYWIPVDRLP